MATSPSPEYRESDDFGIALINGYTFGTKAVQYAAIEGMAIFEGDIVLGTIEQIEARNAAIRGEADAEEAAVITGSQFRWPAGQIPYEIDPAMPEQQRVQDAIAHWEANTVIRFILRTPANAAGLPNFVHFFQGDGCASQVGMQTGRQNITLGVGCDAGRAIHEIGHAVGLWHEQSRQDRDSFVMIHFNNILLGKEGNFNQHVTDGDDVGPYDYGSIMHYERTAFSKNGLETITPTNPATAAIGQRIALSAGDLAAVGSMYGLPHPGPVKKLADDLPTGITKKQADDPPIGIKKVVDDLPVKKHADDLPTGITKKQADDPPVGIKKFLDDPQISVKKISDDVQVTVPNLPSQRRIDIAGGLSPFLLATGHHADVNDTDTQRALSAELNGASAAVGEARRNVIALQTALSSATSDLSRAQEAYGALLAAIQAMS